MLLGCRAEEYVGEVLIKERNDVAVHAAYRIHCEMRTEMCILRYDRHAGMCVSTMPVAYL